MSRLLTRLVAPLLLAALFTPAAPAEAATPTRVLGSVPTAAAGAPWEKEELLFMRSGRLQINNVTTGGRVGTMVSKRAISTAWAQAVPVDLDGDRQDELLLIRGDGRYTFRNVTASGTLGATIRSGSISSSWTTAVALDLDGDRRDELLLYNRNGRYRIVDLSRTGAISSTAIRTGTWGDRLILAPVDLDGDRRHELLVYRPDRSYTYYDLSSTGALGKRIRSGTYASWTTIVGVDATPDTADEILFYNSSTRRYATYNPTSGAALGSALTSGRFVSAWTAIAGLNIERRSTEHPFVDQILDLVNDERQDAGLRPVSSNALAQSEAHRWSGVMAGRGEISHRSDLFHGLPGSATSVGENVAMGYSSAQAVMEAWMASPGHRVNILNGRYTHIGIGVVAANNGWLYYTQIFFGT